MSQDVIKQISSGAGELIAEFAIVPSLLTLPWLFICVPLFLIIAGMVLMAVLLASSLTLLIYVCVAHFMVQPCLVALSDYLGSGRSMPLWLGNSLTIMLALLMVTPFLQKAIKLFRRLKAMDTKAREQRIDIWKNCVAKAVSRGLRVLLRIAPLVQWVLTLLHKSVPWLLLAGAFLLVQNLFYVFVTEPVLRMLAPFVAPAAEKKSVAVIAALFAYVLSTGLFLLGKESRHLANGGVAWNAHRFVRVSFVVCVSFLFPAYLLAFAEGLIVTGHGLSPSLFILEPGASCVRVVDMILTLFYCYYALLLLFLMLPLVNVMIVLFIFVSLIMAAILPFGILNVAPDLMRHLKDLASFGLLAWVCVFGSWMLAAPCFFLQRYVWRPMLNQPSVIVHLFTWPISSLLRTPIWLRHQADCLLGHLLNIPLREIKKSC